jgi:uncharacterized protein
MTLEPWHTLVDPAVNPLLDRRWLDALEDSGSLTETGDWTPAPLEIRRHGALIAAAPAYIHHSSDGDFSQDWGWAEAALRAGIPYYPKFCITVPFTPASGQRLFVAPGVDRRATLSELMALAEDKARDAGCHSIQILFCTKDEAFELASLGFAARMGHQFHWTNPGYGSFDDFLSRLGSKKRHQIRRERAEPAKRGITIETVRGESLRKDAAFWAEVVDRLHTATVEKLPWGRRWVNRSFYRTVLETMPDALEVVAARRDGRVIAGAFNVAASDTLFGRYWGCFEEHPFLHFNVCLYHSIDECIRMQRRLFEPGAGGEHKLARGFEPAATWSAHRFFDPRLDAPIQSAIRAERRSLEAAIAHWRETTPVLRRPWRPGAEPHV